MPAAVRRTLQLPGRHLQGTPQSASSFTYANLCHCCHHVDTYICVHTGVREQLVCSCPPRICGCCARTACEHRSNVHSKVATSKKIIKYSRDTRRDNRLRGEKNHPLNLLTRLVAREGFVMHSRRESCGSYFKGNVTTPALWLVFCMDRSW
jgi:hypothetical protein